MHAKCRKCRKAVYILTAAFLLLLAGISAVPCEAGTASRYEPLHVYSEKNPVKSGEYYFKYLNSQVYLSKKQKSGYQKTPMPGNSYSNGRQAYYVRGGWDGQKAGIYKYIFSSGKETLIKAFPSADNSVSWDICSIYDGRIYLQHRRSDGWWSSRDVDMYAYDMKRKKLSKIKDDCYAAAVNGKYMAAVSARTFAEGASGPVILYQVSSNGLKKIKTLAENGDSNGIRFVGKKLYYADYLHAEDGTSKMTLYQCSQNGTERRKLGTFKNAYTYWPGEDAVTSKYCQIVLNDPYALYKFTYAGKKLKKIGPAPSLGVG